MKTPFPDTPLALPEIPFLDLWARPFPVVLTLDVAWGEMDAFQHVNNIVYFRYFESARIAYFRRVGLDQATSGSVGPILAATHCRFKAPLTFPDRVSVGARVSSVGDDRFQMKYSIASHRLGREAAEGEGTIVTYDYSATKKAPMPQELRRAILELEAGQGNVLP